MDWFGAADGGPMVATRAIHFAATAIVTGTLVFQAVVANPALRSQEAAAKPFRTQTRYVAWISLAVAVISGLAWVLLLTMSLSDESLGEAITSGALRDVLSLTQFGSVSQVRLALAILLAFCLAFERSAFWRWLGLGAAVRAERRPLGLRQRPVAGDPPRRDDDPDPPRRQPGGRDGALRPPAADQRPLTKPLSRTAGEGA